MADTNRSSESVQPPRWAEAALRLLLRPDDVETVSGDLLEEYRESIQPVRGTWRADVWYTVQVGGFVWQATWFPVAIGLLIGAGLGILNLYETARRPLADDDATALLLWGLAVSSLWSAAACAATWRMPRFADAVRVGAIVGMTTILAFHVASIVRVNMFLDLIRYRVDWQNLVVRFNESGFHSLRTFANYEYLKMTPVVMLVGAVVGSISGALGGVVMLAKGKP